MESDDEFIPPSPPPNLTKKRKHKSRLSLHKKRNKLCSEKRENSANTTHIDDISATELSTALKSENCLQRQNRTKSINIYLQSDDSDDSSAVPISLENFDILSSAKLLEQSNKISSCFSHPNRLSKKLQNIGLTTVKQFIEQQNDHPLPSTSTFACQSLNDAEPAPSTSAHQPIETQYTDSELSAVGNIADEAATLLKENLQFSEWPYPMNVQSNAQTNCTNPETPKKPIQISIVQNILNDFDIQSPIKDGLDTIANSTDEDIIPSTPPVLILNKQKLRTYSRVKYEREISSKKFLFDLENLSSESNSENELDDFNANNESHDNDNLDADHCIYDIDIDLNSSRMIMENILNLSSYYSSQSQTFNIDNNKVLEHSLDFGVIKSTDSSYEHNSNLDNCDEREDKKSVELEYVQDISKQKLDKQLLNDDEDMLFANYNSPQILPELKKRKISAAKESKISISTPSTSKPNCIVGQQFLQPKRLKFAVDNQVNFVEASTSFAKVDEYNKNTVHDDERYNAVISMNQQENFHQNKISGFKTASGSNIANISEKMLQKYSNILSDMSCEAETSTTSITEPQIAFNKPNNIVDFGCGFKTARGTNLNIPGKSMKKSANLFEDIMNDFPLDDKFTTNDDDSLTNNFGISNGFTTGRELDSKLPLKKSVKWFEDVQSATDEPKPSTSSMACGFSTAAGSHIKISADAIRKSELIFNEIDNNFETSLNNEKNENQIDHFSNASPMLANRNKFLTSTPNPSAMKMLNKFNKMTPISETNESILHNNQSVQDSIEFLEKLDDQAYDQIFTDFPTISQRSVNRTALKKICLVERFNENTIDDLNERTTATPDQNHIVKLSDEIKLLRQEALIRQQADCLRKPSEIRPRPGTLYLQKMLSNKKSLKDLGAPSKCAADELMRLGISSATIHLNVINANEFKFNMWEHYPIDLCENNINGIDLEDEIKLIMDDNSQVGIDELSAAFLQCPTVDAKLVPDHWITNCLKWIIIKLAGMERCYPHQKRLKWLTPENTLLQLKYRYDREIDRAERSAIRKIVERDDVAAKRMILFVSNIFCENNLEYSMELCDGWYSIRTCTLDGVLTKAIRCRNIQIGTKLMVQGAELIGSDEGCSPLEIPSSTTFNLSGNSTRRVKWYSKLGYCKNSASIPLSLNSINANGGLITKTFVFILRVYPMMFVVRNETASQRTTFHSEKVERRKNISEDQKRLETIERLYSDVSTEVEQEHELKRKAIKKSKRKLSEMDDGKELWQYVEYSNDAESIDMELTASQKHLVTDYYSKIYDDKMTEISNRVKQKLETEKTRPTSTPLLKIRIIDAHKPNGRSAILSIWNANESHYSLKENSFIELGNVSATGVRGKDLQIAAGKRTTFQINNSIQAQPIHHSLARECIELSVINSKNFAPNFNEFDTIAYILCIADAIDMKFQSIYVVDAKQNILCIKFWNGIRAYAYDDVIQVGKIMAIHNLDWRPANATTRNGLPQAFANDFTILTESPNSNALVEKLKKLSDDFKRLPNKDAYMSECNKIINESSQLTKEQMINTPLRLLNINNISSDSPNNLVNASALLRTPQEFSPGVGQPISRIQKRIDKLSMYRSPPPTPALILQHDSVSSVRKPFKNPLTSTLSLSSSNVNNNQENEKT